MLLANEPPHLDLTPNRETWKTSPPHHTSESHRITKPRSRHCSNSPTRMIFHRFFSSFHFFSPIPFRFDPFPFPSNKSAPKRRHHHTHRQPEAVHPFIFFHLFFLLFSLMCGTRGEGSISSHVYFQESREKSARGHKVHEDFWGGGCIFFFSLCDTNLFSLLHM